MQAVLVAASGLKVTILLVAHKTVRIEVIRRGIAVFQRKMSSSRELLRSQQELLRTLRAGKTFIADFTGCKYGSTKIAQDSTLEKDISTVVTVGHVGVCALTPTTPDYFSARTQGLMRTLIASRSFIAR